MTSKTKLLPQVENGEKITFLDFMVPRAILLETNAPFCSDNCVKLVSSWHKLGLTERHQSNPFVIETDEEATVGVHIQLQENCS